jgi:hypothetical protein
MTLKTGIGPFFVGNPIHIDSAPTITNKAITTSAIIQAGIFQAPKTGSIRKLEWLCSSFGSSGGALDIRLETVGSTTGDPTGTLWGTNTNGSATVSGTGWISTTLTADASVTKGDIIALVIKSAGAAQSLSVGYLAAAQVGAQFPYGDRFVSSWLSHGDRPCMALQYSDGSYAFVPDTYPITAVNNATFNSGSTPDEKGVKFALGIPAQILGARVYVDGDGDFSLILYDTDGSTALATKSMDKDYREHTSVTAGTYDLLFDSPQTLAYNGTYRMTIRADSATNLSLVDFDFPTTDVLSQFDQYGTAIAATQRTDAGAWTDTTTKRAAIWPMIGGLDDGQTPGAGEHSYSGAG